jgi:hypothetical protein
LLLAGGRYSPVCRFWGEVQGRRPGGGAVAGAGAPLSERWSRVVFRVLAVLEETPRGGSIWGVIRLVAV